MLEQIVHAKVGPPHVGAIPAFIVLVDLDMAAAEVDDQNFAMVSVWHQMAPWAINNGLRTGFIKIGLSGAHRPARHVSNGRRWPQAGCQPQHRWLQ